MKKNSTMKQNDDELDDFELKEEYDLSQMTILPKGRFDPKRRLGNNVIVLEPDVAKAFPNDEAVNEALLTAAASQQIVKEPSGITTSNWSFLRAVVSPSPYDFCKLFSLQNHLYARPANGRCTYGRTFPPLHPVKERYVGWERPYFLRSILCKKNKLGGKPIRVVLDTSICLRPIQARLKSGQRLTLIA
jgi:hypothetical protein